MNEKREPVAGANVAVIVRKKSSGRIADIGTSGDILGEATTAGDGKFQLLVPRIESSQVWLCALIARAEGRALTWRHLSLDGPPITATLTLSNEQPIRGRFVDLQGQPLAGTRARVQGVMQVRNAPVPDGVGFMTSGVWPAAWPSAVVSDKTGRFAIHGLGAGLGVSLELEPTDKVAPQSVMINTGISEQRGKNDGTYRPQAIRNLTPGEEAILPLAPAQLFEGTVRLADTKQPAPHSRLTVHASQQAFGGSFVGVPGRADAQGHYRIIPRPGIQFYINAYPPDGMPYLISKMEHSWKSGDVKAHVDIDLPRGVLVRGTIVEADTNRPVPNCSIQYVPTQAAERKAPKGVVTGWQGIETSNARGEFAICVLPGLGHLLVHGPSADFVYQEIGGRELDQGRPGGQRHYSHAIERIDAKVDAASPINLTIKLKRGATITGRLLTPDNRPVEEALMMSRLQISDFSPTWRAFPETLRGGTFAVSGLAPGVEYPIYFLDQRRHLGATARLTANNDNPEPAIIRLAPCGKAKARFIDSDGKPIPDLEPNLYMVVTPGRFKFDPATYRLGQLAADEDFVQNIDRQNQTPSPKTDANGILTFKFLIPGAAYRVNGGRKGELAALKEFTAEADKTVDLGDIVADRPRER